MNIPDPMDYTICLKCFLLTSAPKLQADQLNTFGNYILQIPTLYWFLNKNKKYGLVHHIVKTVLFPVREMDNSLD